MSHVELAYSAKEREYHRKSDGVPAARETTEADTEVLLLEEDDGVL